MPERPFRIDLQPPTLVEPFECQRLMLVLKWLACALAARALPGLEPGPKRRRLLDFRPDELVCLTGHARLPVVHWDDLEILRGIDRLEQSETAYRLGYLRNAYEPTTRSLGGPRECERHRNVGFRDRPSQSAGVDQLSYGRFPAVSSPSPTSAATSLIAPGA